MSKERRRKGRTGEEKVKCDSRRERKERTRKNSKDGKRRGEKRGKGRGGGGK